MKLEYTVRKQSSGMTPAKPEWLLWAHKLESRQSSLAKEFNSCTNATNKTVGELQMETKDLAASTTHLQHELNALMSRIIQLEKETADRDQAHTEIHTQLRASIASHYRSVQDGAHLLHEWKADAVEGFKRRDLEVRELKATIEKLSATQCHDCEKPPDAGLPPEATRQDARRHLEWKAVPAGQSKSLANVSIDLAPQGSQSLEEYLHYGKQAVPDMFKEAIKALETETVKTFARNIRDKPLRVRLWSSMQEIGWTWHNVQVEIHKMVEDTKRRRKSRRILQQPPADPH